MRQYSSILVLVTAFVPLLLTACSDEPEQRETVALSPADTSPSEEVVTAPHQEPFGGVIGNTISESTPSWPDVVRAPEGAPNVLLVMLDDVGFGQLGSYGAHRIETPNIDRLAEGGLRYNNFHATPLCSPTRAAILTGRNHHSLSMGVIAELSTGFPGYSGRMPLSHGMLSEVLGPAGWSTFALGKWHLTPVEDVNLAANRRWWPVGRGFDRY
jgi:arylsulfatase